MKIYNNTTGGDLNKKIVGHTIESEHAKICIDLGWLFSDCDIYLYDFIVEEEYRNQGVGYSFLSSVLLWLKKTYPNKNIVLRVEKGNIPAEKLYKKIGFKYRFFNPIYQGKIYSENKILYRYLYYENI